MALKQNSNGKIIKYKARLVARGFSQQPGVDFEETYAPVSQQSSLRVFLTIAGSLQMPVFQADIEGAYLNGKTGS
jgi:hypothetical protein